jgi:histidinol-phosphate aminotransferase
VTVPHTPVPHTPVPHTPVPHTPVPHTPVPHTPVPHTPVPPLPIRPDLASRRPYGAPQLDVPVRLNTNENPYPPSAALAADIASAAAAVATGLNRYPDRDALALRTALADYLGHGLTAANIWAANGSNEVIQHVLLAFAGPGRTALGFEPSYSMHPTIAQVTGTRWVAARRTPDFGLDEREAVAAIERDRPDVVFVTSPNNPTGTVLPIATIEAICAAAPGMVVVDEAYAEFTRAGSATALSLLPGYPRLVVVRTMSKAFAMAGARIGYLAADPAVVQAMLLVRLPYHLSAVTQAVGLAALAHTAELLASVERVRAERDKLVAWLRAAGLTAADSDTNFVLFGTFADSHAVWQALLDRGVLVRETGPPGWLRVSVGTAAEMAAFRDALTEIVTAVSITEGTGEPR